MVESAHDHKTRFCRHPAVVFFFANVTLKSATIMNLSAFLRFSPSQGASLLLVLASLLVAPSLVQAQIQPEARKIVQSVSNTLGQAKTVQVTAAHTVDEAMGFGSRLEKGKIRITLKRPNQFHIMQPAGEETREIVYDGKTFCLLQPEAGLHGIVRMPAASLEQFSDLADARLGFRPPVAELLANDVSSQIFREVTAARVVGRSRVGWVRCEQISLVQEGMITDVWVGVKDNLPRRIRFTYTDRPGRPAWDIRLSAWVLNQPVDERLFARRPGPESQEVKMVRSRD